jgi:hypothetical protein
VLEVHFIQKKMSKKLQKIMIWSTVWKNEWVIARIWFFVWFARVLSQRRRYTVGNSARWFLKTKEAAESKPFFDHEGVIFSTPTLLSFTKLKIRRSFSGAEQV